MNDKIFISYRREDSSWSTGRIYDRLVKHFPENQIFIDIDSIGLGEDFVISIENSVNSCDVLLAVIGPTWHASISQKSEEIDFVRIEIEAAIKNNIRVIPILLENTKMPNPKDLPEGIRAITRRNAFLLNPISFNSEIEKLIASIKKYFSETATERQHLINERFQQKEIEEQKQRLFDKQQQLEKEKQVLLDEQVKQEQSEKEKQRLLDELLEQNQIEGERLRLLNEQTRQKELEEEKQRLFDEHVKKKQHEEENQSSMAEQLSQKENEKEGQQHFGEKSTQNNDSSNTEIAGKYRYRSTPSRLR